MKTKKVTKTLEKKLLSKFGSHEKIASNLGITYRRWCQIRERDENLSRRLLIIIDFHLKGRTT